MKKRLLVLISAAFIACAHGKIETLLRENFEGGIPETLRVFKSRISENPGEAISGKASLVREAANWGPAFEFDAGKFNAVEVSFDYKILSGSPRAAPHVQFIYKPGDGPEKSAPGTDYRFVRGRGGPERSKNVFHGAFGSPARVRVSVPAGVKMAFDNLRVRGVSVPARADWSAPHWEVFETCRYNPFSPHYLRLNDRYLSMSEGEFFPFIDKYGQFKHRGWAGKIRSDADLKKRAAEEKKWFEDNPPIASRDKFYGLVDPARRYAATGRFRTEKVGGKWFFVTPDGNLFWALGMCGLGYDGRFPNPSDEPSEYIGKARLTPFEGRERFYDDVSDPRHTADSGGFKRAYHGMNPAKGFDFYGRNLELKYGRGAPGKISLLKARAGRFGINLGGHLCDPAALKAAEIPFTVTVYNGPNLPISGGYKLHGWWQTPPDWFNPEFEPALRKKLEKLAPLTQSPYCVGVFIDGELPWISKPCELTKGVLSCKPSQPAKAALREMLQKKYPSVADFNSAWGTKYSSWDGFMEDTALAPETEAAKADALAFEDAYMRRYFEVCRRLVKEIDPGLLYLGCSFSMSGREWEKACRISSEYCDVISCNTYRYGVAGFSLPEGSRDRPVLIGEWHFAPQDEGTFGVTMIPSRTREGQCALAEAFLKSALENPNIIGADWFEWVDIATTGRFDKADSGVGFLDIADTPHYPLVETFRRISENMYETRLDSKGEGARDADDDRNW